MQRHGVRNVLEKGFTVPRGLASHCYPWSHSPANWSPRATAALQP